MLTTDKIIKYIKTKGQASAHELVEYLDISRQALFKHHLSKLVEQGILGKIGKPPKVFYILKKEKKLTKEKFEISKKDLKIIEKNYLLITPSGEKKAGFDGFLYWCEKNNLSPDKTVKEYVKTIEKYNTYKKNNLVDGTDKLKNTLKKIYLNKVWYLDFYSIERFGKTRLGKLLLYAKQSQNKHLIKDLISEIKPNVNEVIKKYKIDGIGFVPPTVKRDVQIMKELEKGLGKGKRVVSILKIKTEITVPQKTLNKLQDRIENARNTIVVDDNSQYKNILLIDDAIGSGATINETAKKIRDRDICKGKIYGLAITGSFKGFDVISEV